MKDKSTFLYLFFWMICFFVSPSMANTTAEKNMREDNANPCAFLSITATPDGIYCGASRGAIDVSISGGQGPLSRRMG